MAKRMTLEEQTKQWELLGALQEIYPDTTEGLLNFADDILQRTIPGKPRLNRTQGDMLDFLQTGPLYRMIMAQRGQAKTTVAAIYAVFRLIHKPSLAVVIFSQSSKRAKEISTWIVKIFRNVDYLQFMCPDASNGDSDSTEKFDIHYSLKGAPKSPSVVCQSIEAGCAGMRAGLLIADDVESQKNTRTVEAKAILEDTTKEFESINSSGDIIYLGTPQSSDSIYTELPARGYEVRIWTGRYPTVEEMPDFDGLLAPMFRRDIELNPELQSGQGIGGRSGHATCPEMDGLDDAGLTKKEGSQGAAKFQLQFMLNTQLSDASKFPLKLNNLAVALYNALEGPVSPMHSKAADSTIKGLPKIGNLRDSHFQAVVDKPYDWRVYDRKIMYIDPSGGGANGDEMAYSILGLINTTMYLLDIGGTLGGYEEASLMKLVNAAKAANAREVFIEKNYGNGAHMAALKPLFEKHHPVTLLDDNVMGQKEVRICDILEPVISNHRLVISEEVIKEDTASAFRQYPTGKAITYTLMHQMAHISKDRGCLRHDDRLDSLAGAVRQCIEELDYDANRVEKERAVKDMKAELRVMLDPALRRERMTGVVQKSQTRKKRY